MHSSEQLNDNHSGNDVPMKKGKLSHEDDESIDTVGGRPVRQASCVIEFQQNGEVLCVTFMILFYRLQNQKFSNLSGWLTT